MVVLSAAILAKSKVLLARQFVEISRMRIEGLLSAFPKLIDSGKDHTFLETDSVRYVYQPMENLFLVLITNKESNIIEDLDTLKLLSKIVQEKTERMISESEVAKNIFPILFAFDEVISFGYREPVGISQVRTFVEMESHEERFAEMVEHSKILEAKETAKRKQWELTKQRAAQAKAEQLQNLSGLGGRAGAGAGALGSYFRSPGSTMNPRDGFGGGGSGSGMDNSTPEQTTFTATSPISPATAAAPRTSLPQRGLQLGKKKLLSSDEPASTTTPGKDESSTTRGSTSSSSATSTTVNHEELSQETSATVVNPLAEACDLKLVEKVTGVLETDGGIKEVSVQGSLCLTVMDGRKGGLTSIQFEANSDAFKTKVHPKLNKQTVQEGLLQIRDASQPYPPNVPLHLLKWTAKSPLLDSMMPFSVTCWPSAKPDGFTLMLELEVINDAFMLQDMTFSFAVPPRSVPKVVPPKLGETRFNDGKLEWVIPVVDGSSQDLNSGCLELEVANADFEAVLPINVWGISRQILYPVEVRAVYHLDQPEQTLSHQIEKECEFQLTIQQNS
eukprot:Filipodium_phascolosomae@DN536_c0_g1_i1.p1